VLCFLIRGWWGLVEYETYCNSVMVRLAICFVETFFVLQALSYYYIPKIRSSFDLGSSTISFRNWVSSFILMKEISSNFYL